MPATTATSAAIRMMSFVRRLWRPAGEYFLSDEAAELAVVSETAGDVFSSAILFSREVLPDSVLANTESTNEGDFREIVVV